MYMSCCMILYCYVGEIFPMGPTSKICSIYIYVYSFTDATKGPI